MAGPTTLTDLTDLLSNTPRTLEPTARPASPLPIAPSSAVGAGALLGSGGDDGGINPLYLLGLAGSVLTKQPWDNSPGMAERLLPAYLAQQNKRQLEATAVEDYGKVQKALEQAIQSSDGDYKNAANVYSQWLQAEGGKLRSEDAAKAAFGALGEFRKGAQSQAVERQDREAILRTFDQVSDGRAITGSTFLRLALANGAQKDTAFKVAKELIGEGAKVFNNNGVITLVDPVTAKVTQVGSSLEPSKGQTPAQTYTPDGQGGFTAAPVAGALFEQPQGARVAQVNAEGTGVDTFANRPPKLEITDDLKKGLELAGAAGVDVEALKERFQSGDPIAGAYIRELTRKGGASNNFKPNFQETMGAIDTNPGASAEDVNDPGYYAGRVTNAPTDAQGNPAFVNRAGAVLANQSERAVAQAASQAERIAPIEVGKAVKIAQATLPLEIQKIRENLIAKRQEEAGDPYREGGRVFIDKNTFNPVRLTKEQVRSGDVWDKVADVSVPEAQQIGLIKGALPIFPAVEDLSKRLLAGAKGGNLGQGAINDFNKTMGDPNVAQFKQLMVQLNLESGRILGGSVRVPVTMLKMLEGTMPTTYSSVQAAQRELSTLKTDLQNRLNSMVGKDMLPIDTGGSFTLPSGNTYRRVP